MSFLPAGAAATLRALAATALTARCTASRPAVTSVAGGSPATSWIDVDPYVAVPCSARASVPGDAVIGDARQATQSWRVRLGGVALAVGAPAIKTGDRLTITGHDIPGAADPLVLYAVAATPHTGGTASQLVLATDRRPGGT